MKIKNITDKEMRFDNGNVITFDHEQDCCESNYADFKQIDDLAKTIDFDPDLIFEVAEYGFRFGDARNGLFFVPCYSYQNGYYTDEVDIYYNEELKINTTGKVDYE